MPLAILDRQHGANRKGAGSWDPGAWVDVDGDGVKEAHEQEARLTPLYIAGAYQELAGAGWDVETLGTGTYSSRHTSARSLGSQEAGRPCAYLACHGNAGGGDYALVAHDMRSARGRDLAGAIAAELEKLPGISRCKVVPTTATDPQQYIRNLHATIAGIYSGPAWLAGVCLEPAFLDQPKHRELWTPEGGRLIGAALARALVVWAGQVRKVAA